MKHINQQDLMDIPDPRNRAHAANQNPACESDTPSLFPRYARHLSLPDFGEAAQLRLTRSSALIVGLGGLGSAAALYMTAAGIGRLLLVDFDTVDETNLQRQILYRMTDVGLRKTKAAHTTLQALNPILEVEELDGRLTDSTAANAVSRCDIVIDCSDNFATRAAVNAACLMHRRPLVSGAALRWEGRVAIFDLRDGHSPCLACLHPDTRESLESCERGGVIGPLVGIIGSLQALEAIKLLSGTSNQSDLGRLLRYAARTGHFSEYMIERRPDCPVCGNHPVI